MKRPIPKPSNNWLEEDLPTLHPKAQAEIDGKKKAIEKLRTKAKCGSMSEGKAAAEIRKLLRSIEEIEAKA